MGNENRSTPSMRLRGMQAMGGGMQPMGGVDTHSGFPMRRGVQPTGSADAHGDFLTRLSLLEDDGSCVDQPYAAAHSRAATSNSRAYAPAKRPLTGVLKRGISHGRRPARHGIVWHQQLVTRVEDAAAGVDRKVIPCLAFGGVNQFSPEEERFVVAKITVKHHRSELSKRDPVARQHLNAAAADEARLRAAQVTEALSSLEDESLRFGAHRRKEAAAAAAQMQSELAERHYLEHLNMMQRANKLVHQQRQQMQGGPPTQPHPVTHQPPVQSQYAAASSEFARRRQEDQRLATQHHNQRMSTRVAEPPGGRSTFVFG